MRIIKYAFFHYWVIVLIEKYLVFSQYQNMVILAIAKGRLAMFKKKVTSKHNISVMKVSQFKEEDVNILGR